jgi:hypothetical protein
MNKILNSYNIIGGNEQKREFDCELPHISYFLIFSSLMIALYLSISVWDK